MGELTVREQAVRELAARLNLPVDHVRETASGSTDEQVFNLLGKMRELEQASREQVVTLDPAREGTLGNLRVAAGFPSSGRDGNPKSVTLCRFCGKHPYYKTTGSGEPICHKCLHESRPIVNKGELIGRNDPCPCGSGKKFKRCHKKGGV